MQRVSIKDFQVVQYDQWLNSLNSTLQSAICQHVCLRELVVTCFCYLLLVRYWQVDWEKRSEVSGLYYPSGAPWPLPHLPNRIIYQKRVLLFSVVWGNASEMCALQRFDVASLMAAACMHWHVLPRFSQFKSVITLFQNSDDTTRWISLPQHLVKPVHTSRYIYHPRWRSVSRRLSPSETKIRSTFLGGGTKILPDSQVNSSTPPSHKLWTLPKK